MRFDNLDNKQSWGIIADDFVVERNNKRINYFVKEVHKSKVLAER